MLKGAFLYENFCACRGTSFWCIIGPGMLYAVVCFTEKSEINQITLGF